MEKRVLQCLIAVAACVPTGSGLYGLLTGYPQVDFDSHFRFLCTVLMTIGIGFWTCIPHIETKTERMRILTALVFIGGMGRIVSIITMGIPMPGMIFALVMEMVVAPALCLWQSRVSKAALS